MIAINGMEQPLILASSTSLGTRTFRERVEVAAAAGFDALGLELQTYRRITAEECSPAELAAILHDNGVKVAELESVLGYAVPPERLATPLRGGRTYTSPGELDELCEMAQLFGGTHLVAVGALDCETVEPDAAERFAALCDKVAHYSLRVALEIHPRTNIPDIAAALKIVRASGRPNGGVNVDSWHHIRGANDPGMLRALRPDDLALIQLSDGRITATTDYVHDMLHCRDIPGAGEFDLRGFLTGVLASGGSAPISVEVISDALRSVPPKEAAARAVRQTTALLETVGEPR